jgi:hypothetical protein
MPCSFVQTDKCHFVCNVQAEGIFRINAENSQEELVRDRLNRGIVPYGIDVHCLAGLIKVSIFLSFKLCDSVDITSFLNIYTLMRELLLVVIIFIGGNLSYNRLHFLMEPNLLFSHEDIVTSLFVCSKCTKNQQSAVGESNLAFGISYGLLSM